MKIITSRTNQEIKSVAALHAKKERTKTGLFIAQHYNVIKTLLECATRLKQLYCTEKQKELALQLCSSDLITIVPDSVMEKISTAKTPSGMIGVFFIPQPVQTIATPGLVLAQMSDPGNVGTLIRTAAAMNFKTIICVDSVDPYSPKVVQASAGTIGCINLMQLTWDEIIEKKADIPLVALIVSGGKSVSDISAHSLLVVGSEAHGIWEQWLLDCDEKVTIAMPGKTESLNAAVAGSIAMYLLIQQ